MNCGLCDKTDGMCYTSQPPQVKCTVTGEFHLFSDKCNVIELFQQVKAERDAAVRDLEHLMKCFDGAEACLLCEKKESCKAIWDEDNPCKCAPKWRSPQQEETPLYCGDSFEGEEKS